jgi:regulator of cell morphogenesis and NO signaling
MSEPRDDAITEFLHADHVRLDQLWDRCRVAMRASNIEAFRKDFPEFASGLRRHIRMEEELLFPAFEERTGMRQAGPTAVMRAEHTQIRALLDHIAALANGGDCSTVAREVESGASDPIPLLSSHNQKEERVLYPMLDQMFGADEKESLLSKMRSL